MRDDDPPTESHGGRGFLLVIGSLALFAATIWFALPRVVPRRTVIITVGTNGVPHLLGVSLGNETIRRGVLRVLGQYQAYVIIDVPRGGLERTNALEIERDMADAGITGAIHGPIK